MKLFLLLLSFFLLSPTGISSTSAYAEETFDDVVDNIIEETDLDDLDELFNSMNVPSPYSFRQLLDAVLHSDSSLTVQDFLTYAVSVMVGNVKELVAQSLIILLTVLLLSLLQNATSGFGKSSTGKIAYVACYGVIVGVVCVIVGVVTVSVSSVVSTTKRFSEIVFPILTSIIAVIGAAGTYAVYQPLILIFSQLITTVVTGIVLPMFYVSFACNIIGNISDYMKLEKFSDLAYKAGTWMLTVVFGVFITYTTAQGITGAGFDSLAAKSAKYALDSYVPIVGSYLKEGFDLVLAGCVVVKNALGFVSVIILLFFFLSPVVKILVTSLFLRLTAAICEPFGDKKIVGMLTSVAKSLTLPLVVCVSMAFSMLTLCMLIIVTCNGGVL